MLSASISRRADGYPTCGHCVPCTCITTTQAPIHPGVIGPSTTLYKLASEQGAMILALEHRYCNTVIEKRQRIGSHPFRLPCVCIHTHRYYSEVSNPTAELNRTTRELLRVNQALEDAAHYIETLIIEVKENVMGKKAEVRSNQYGH